MYSLKYNISILHMYLLLIEYRCQIKDIYIFYGGNYDNRRGKRKILYSHKDFKRI